MTEPAAFAAGSGWRKLPRWFRVPFVLLVGGTVVGIGIALLVLPGPGILVIFVGLAILATEFVWARRYLDKAKDHGTRLTRGVKAKFTNKSTSG